MLDLFIISNLFGWAYTTIMILYGLTTIGIILVVVSEHRNPLKSLAWVTPTDAANSTPCCTTCATPANQSTCNTTYSTTTPPDAWCATYSSSAHAPELPYE